MRTAHLCKIPAVTSQGAQAARHSVGIPSAWHHVPESWDTIEDVLMSLTPDVGTP